jgi:hypothetical protein
MLNCNFNYFPLPMMAMMRTPVRAVKQQQHVSFLDMIFVFDVFLMFFSKLDFNSHHFHGKFQKCILFCFDF